jgi:DNA-binding IclR family transcriptional regulator
MNAVDGSPTPDVATEEIEAPTRRTPGASSSRKVLQLLLSFSESRPNASVAELAELLQTPVPTTYRHVALLKELDILEEGPAGRYHPTAKVMPVARAAQLSNGLADLARPTITATAERFRETVMLLQLVGGAAVCVELTECDRPMRYTFQRGHAIPLGRGASGKMMLALLDERARATWEREHPLDEIRATEVDEARSRGFAVSVGELDDGVFACSVPVLGTGTRPCVLTVAGPAARISEDQRASAVHVLRDAALHIRREASRFSLDIP